MSEKSIWQSISIEDADIEREILVIDGFNEPQKFGFIESIGVWATADNTELSDINVSKWCYFDELMGI